MLFNRDYIKIYVVEAKLTTEQVRTLTRSIEENGGRAVTRPEEATIIVSSTRLWNRLRKHLPDRGYVSCDIVLNTLTRANTHAYYVGSMGMCIKESKKIVTLEWLQDSLEKGEQQPFNEKYLIHIPSPLDRLNIVSEDRARAVSPSASATPSPQSRAGSVSTVDTPERDDSPLLHAVQEVAAQGKQAARSPVYPLQPVVLPASNNIAPPKWRNRRFAWVVVRL